jgi:hypothetical protein
MAEEEEEERINKTKGGREVRGEHRRSTSFIAHFRQMTRSLNSAETAG